MLISGNVMTSMPRSQAAAISSLILAKFPATSSFSQRIWTSAIRIG